MNRRNWMSAVTIAVGLGSAARADLVYDAALGTLPQAQGWIYAGNIPSPGPDHVSGGVFQYGPTENGDQFTWSHHPTVFDFTSTRWSLTAEVRLTETTFGVTEGFRRGGFVLYLQDDAGNWIVADVGSAKIGLCNDGFCTSDPCRPQSETGPITEDIGSPWRRHSPGLLPRQLESACSRLATALGRTRASLDLPPAAQGLVKAY